MLRLRLTRVGKKKQPHYRIVVADSKKAVQGKFISIVGWYNPHTKEINYKEDEVKDWLSKGAMPSNTLAKLFQKQGVKLPDWVKITQKVRQPKKEAEPEADAPKKEEAAAEPVEAAKAEEQTETPAEETVAEEAQKETETEEEDKK